VLLFYVRIILHYIKVWLHVSTNYIAILRQVEHTKIIITFPNII
jgi:hypothetical protein